MTGTTIATLQELAARFRDDERNLTLYFADLDTPPPEHSLNRVFGPPVGVTDEQWPTFPELAELLSQTNSMQLWDPSDDRMEHVFTVDLRGVELLGVPEDAAAMMLFLSNAGFHRACSDDNPHTAVRFLRAADLHRGVYQGSLPRRSLQRWSRRFSLVPIDVPGDVFDVPELDLPAGDPLAELYDAIARAPARLGGCPIWVDEPEAHEGWLESSPTLPWAKASDEPGRPATRSGQAAVPRVGHRTPLGSRRTTPHADGSFLMQFQRRFADVNLGSRGVMYVSGRSAYVPTP